MKIFDRTTDSLGASLNLRSLRQNVTQHGDRLHPRRRAHPRLQRQLHRREGPGHEPDRPEPHGRGVRPAGPDGRHELGGRDVRDGLARAGRPARPGRPALA